MAIKVNDWVHEEADKFIKRKYVTKADARQRAMGLCYVEAEQEDLIREVAHFARVAIGASRLSEK